MIDQISAINTTAKVTNLGQSAKGGGTSFREKLAELDKVPSDKSFWGTEAYQELKTLGESLTKEKTVSFQTLLLYQVRAHEFGLRVELLSKLAESASTTLRKFQSAQ